MLAQITLTQSVAILQIRNKLVDGCQLILRVTPTLNVKSSEHALMLLEPPTMFANSTAQLVFLMVPHAWLY